MARQPTLAEILADDTGRIRPEVADLLMEPPPQGPRPQQPRPIVRPQARRQPGVQQQQPRRFGAGWATLSLVIFAVMLALIISKDREPDNKVSGLSNYQDSKENSLFAKPRKGLPLPPMAEEKTENAIRNLQDEKTNSGCIGNEQRYKIQRDQLGPYKDDRALRAESFNRRSGVDGHITERRQFHRRYAYPARPSPENNRGLIKLYVARPSPNSVERCYPRNYPDFRQPYNRNRPQVASYGDPRPPIVIREKMPHRVEFHSYRRNFYPYPHVRERIRISERHYRYYRFTPPRRFH